MGFRALKTKGNTPKYGLIFHSSFIGRASAKNKGRISRYLANKCSIASRIDCFSGAHLTSDSHATALKVWLENGVSEEKCGEREYVMGWDLLMFFCGTYSFACVSMWPSNVYPSGCGISQGRLSKGSYIWLEGGIIRMC